MFVTDGVIRTAFAPTHGSIGGYEGHTEEFVEYYIKLQEMIKVYANEGSDITDDVDIGERAEVIPEPDLP